MSEHGEDLRARLPLRYPYLQIDRLVEVSPERVVAIKNVSFGESCFQGHFPEPLPAVMPGTLIVEAMAQTAALLLPREGGAVGYLVGIRNARFRRHVVPGDSLLLKATLVRRRLRLVSAAVEARVDGELAAEATLSLLLGGSPDGACAD